jgi:energy-coupling factor transport system ATP-binding protein
MKNKRIIQVDNISYSYPVGAAVDEEFETESASKPDMQAQTPASDAQSPKALDEVSLDIQEGQFICILGNNGSGKSTLARHLNALIMPDEGTVWINGMNSQDEANIWNIRSQVGMVFQNPDNQMVASQVDEEVAFGPENMGVPSEQIIKDVADALEAVGMTGKNKENPTNLSGGQKQRVAVAGILAMKPKCIVLDESTAMLDPQGRDEIMNTVLNLNKSQGITLICITHYMEEAVNADKIFVMSHGNLVMQGTPKEIFSRTDELSAAGLKLPVICQLAEELRIRELNVPKDIITEDELYECINKIRSQDI